MCLSTPAFALFDGDYAPGNWTATTSGVGVIDTSGAPGSISMTSNNNEAFVHLNQDFTIVLLANGEVMFDWDFFTTDTGLMGVMRLFGTHLAIYSTGHFFN